MVSEHQLLQKMERQGHLYHRDARLVRQPRIGDLPKPVWMGLKGKEGIPGFQGSSRVGFQGALPSNECHDGRIGRTGKETGENSRIYRVRMSGKRHSCMGASNWSIG